MTDEGDVLERLERARDDLVEYVLEFGNVPSPRGHEAVASRFQVEWLHDRGLDTRRQPVVGDRANIVSPLEKTGMTHSSYRLWRSLATGVVMFDDSPPSIENDGKARYK